MWDFLLHENWKKVADALQEYAFYRSNKMLSILIFKVKIYDIFFSTAKIKWQITFFIVLLGYVYFFLKMQKLFISMLGIFCVNLQGTFFYHNS